MKIILHTIKEPIQFWGRGRSYRMSRLRRRYLIQSHRIDKVRRVILDVSVETWALIRRVFIQKSACARIVVSGAVVRWIAIRSDGRDNVIHNHWKSPRDAESEFSRPQVYVLGLKSFACPSKILSTSRAPCKTRTISIASARAR